MLCFSEELSCKMTAVDLRAEASCRMKLLYRNSEDLSLLPMWFSEDVLRGSFPQLFMVTCYLSSAFYLLIVNFIHECNVFRSFIARLSPSTSPGPPTAPSQAHSLLTFSSPSFIIPRGSN